MPSALDCAVYDGKVPGVYISFPFCAQKCTYCNFSSGIFTRQIEDEYHQRLVQKSVSILSSVASGERCI